MSAAASEADRAALYAILRILQHAAVLLVAGHGPNVAIKWALMAHRPSLTLALVARAAWVLAVRKGLTAPSLYAVPSLYATRCVDATDDAASTTTPEGPDEHGGQGSE